MISTGALENKINEYYDEEMNPSQLLNYEARIANSIMIKEYTYQKCFEFYKISNSIKQVKCKLRNNAERTTQKILVNMQEELFFNRDTVFLKCIYKHLSSFFLYFRRNNSKKLNRS